MAGILPNILQSATQSAEVAALAETLKGRGMSDTEAYNTARQIVIGQAPAQMSTTPSFFSQYKWPIIIGIGVVVAYFVFFNKPQSVIKE